MDNDEQRFKKLHSWYKRRFGESAAHQFSAPGRTEIGGNHTDHNNGRVLAAAIHLDSIAVASANSSKSAIVYSEGYEKPFIVDISRLEPLESERGTSAALIRGLAARFTQLHLSVGGFSACISSNVLPGSGLSSSASFEVLIGTIFNYVFNDGRIDPVTLATMGQYAENEYFGKPCGLMDQIACANGGVLKIDFKDPENPLVEKTAFDLEKHGYALIIVDTGGSHANLTPDYASVRQEMKQVAQVLGHESARGIEFDELMTHNTKIRDEAGDRAFLRVLHFIEENRRVDKQMDALRRDDLPEFLSLVNESGNSSFKYVQNSYSTRQVREQGVSLALALSEMFIRQKGEGACRVHGGGFAGTIQAFIPLIHVDEYIDFIEGVFGLSSATVISLRDTGSSPV